MDDQGEKSGKLHRGPADLSVVSFGRSTRILKGLDVLFKMRGVRAKLVDEKKKLWPDEGGENRHF